MCPDQGDVMKRKKFVQGMLPFPNGWGGVRKGAGRKRSPQSGVRHVTRVPLAARYPVHVTVRVGKGLPSLRKQAEFLAVRGAFEKGCERFGFRLVHYSVQADPLHLLVEAKDRTALTRGMQGLLVRIAKALNKLWGRAGKVFGDRFHDRVLKTPREVRNALAYVLNNAPEGGARRRSRRLWTSGWWFDGWREKLTLRGIDDIPRHVAKARTWLLGTGWRRHRLIDPEEVPGAT